MAMEKSLAKPPRPGQRPPVNVSNPTSDASVITAWMQKKSDGMVESIMGKSRLQLTLDYSACTLGWAKPNDVATKVGFKDIEVVELSTKSCSDATSDASTKDDSSDAGSRPLSRSSSRSSFGARIRSISPFRKSQASEYGLTIRAAGKLLELTCESKAQADQWLTALQRAQKHLSTTSPSQADGKQTSTVVVDNVPLSSRGYPQQESATDAQNARASCEKGDAPRSSRRISHATSPIHDKPVPFHSNLDGNEDDGDDVASPPSIRSSSQASKPSNAPETGADKTESDFNGDLVIDVQQDSPETVNMDEKEERKVFDKRELRRRNRDAFEKQISAWREKHPTQVKAGPTGLDCQRVRVCVRKRPLFQNECAEFDMVTVRGPELVVHNCLTKADMKSLYVEHTGFHFARAFDDTVDNSALYEQCASSVVHHALEGGSATIFMFGQTGSGKTFTAQSFLEQASQQLFGGASLSKVCVGAFEIAGKHMTDLQDPENPGKDLKIMTDLNVGMAPPGQLEEQQESRVKTKVRGLKWCCAESASELLQLCKGAQARRSTRATQANKESSRSHYVLKLGRSEDDILLTLVDCAGSERNEDSTHHSAQDRKEAAHINSTIFTLKECFRTMREANGKQPPFRDSFLTRVLADSFTSDTSRVVAIGTVSPSSKDTEHTLETLKSLQMLQETQASFNDREDIKLDIELLKHPRAWSEQEVRDWLAKAAEGGAAPWLSGLANGTDGKMLTRMPVARFVQLCGGNKELGDAIFKELRLEMQRADDSRRKKW
eukprot:TRINITY_DN28654_c0_g1_i1.p1 TRINITY_DN28654_c0_g1~~TRINITY_DN28654_c0_g1_i1.p1  ORF type:complete len:777 (-),score=78.28 TRINITY_DN28654_c0_g1_i1:342-2672(-)